MARKGGEDRGLFERPKGSKFWWIRFAGPDGRPHVRKIGTKKQARQAYDDTKSLIRLGQWAPGRHPGLQDVPDEHSTLAAEMKQWAERKARIRRSGSRYLQYAREWAAEFPGRISSSITTADVERVIGSRLQRGVKPATVNRSLAHLRSFLNELVQEGRLLRSPMTRIQQLRENNARIRWLSWDEQMALLEHTSEWLMAAVLIAIGTGLRQMEQLRLRWADVDFNASVIYVRKPKGKKAETIPLRPDVAALFRDLPSRMRSPWCFPSVVDSTKPMPRGGAIRGAFETAVEKAGIQDFHWHDLRHSFASRLAMAGKDIYEIQRLMRHKSIVMTQRYAHLSPKHLREAIADFTLEPGEIELEPGDLTLDCSAKDRVGATAGSPS